MKPGALLKGKRFEQKRKLVLDSPDFADHCGVMHDAQLRFRFNHLLDCITNGFRLPEEYYSSRVNEQGDRLLRELGVKHLHLDSDVIVYMAEFDTWVELIEINTHVHLETEPRGKGLKGRFRAATAAAGAAVGAISGAATKKPKLKSKKKRPRRR